MKQRRHDGRILQRERVPLGRARYDAPEVELIFEDDHIGRARLHVHGQLDGLAAAQVALEHTRQVEYTLAARWNREHLDRDLHRLAHANGARLRLDREPGGRVVEREHGRRLPLILDEEVLLLHDARGHHAELDALDGEACLRLRHVALAEERLGRASLDDGREHVLGRTAQVGREDDFDRQRLLGRDLARKRRGHECRLAPRRHALGILPSEARRVGAMVGDRDARRHRGLENAVGESELQLFSREAHLDRLDGRLRDEPEGVRAVDRVGDRALVLRRLIGREKEVEAGGAAGRDHLWRALFDLVAELDGHEDVDAQLVENREVARDLRVDRDVAKVDRLWAARDLLELVRRERRLAVGHLIERLGLALVLLGREPKRVEERRWRAALGCLAVCVRVEEEERREVLRQGWREGRDA